MSGPDPDPDPEHGPWEWPRPLAAELLQFAEQAMAQARWDAPGAQAQTEGMITHLRIRRSQICCTRCYGDLDADGAAGYLAAAGTGDCSCLERCPRPGCQAPEDPFAGLDDPGLPPPGPPPASG